MINVVVFVLAGGSSGVVVLVARVFVLIPRAIAVVILVIVDIVVCNLETGKGGSVRYI
jgi:hypothetical protein